jgi:hypothetical protein
MWEFLCPNCRFVVNRSISCSVAGLAAYIKFISGFMFRIVASDNGDEVNLREPCLCSATYAAKCGTYGSEHRCHSSCKFGICQNVLPTWLVDLLCRSCVNKGYMKDDYVRFFVRRATRRAPIINRGMGCLLCVFSIVWCSEISSIWETWTFFLSKLLQRVLCTLVCS